MRRRRGRGYSFLEVLLVVALLATLAAVTVPRMGGTFTATEFRTAVRDLVSTMRYARQTAVVSGEGVELRIEPEAGRYRLVQVALDSEGRVEGEIEEFEEDAVRLAGEARQEQVLPESVFFALLYVGGGEVGGEPRIVFYPDGSATGAIIGLMNEEGKAVQLELFRTTGMTRVSRGEIRAPEASEPLFIRGEL